MVRTRGRGRPSPRTPVRGTHRGIAQTLARRSPSLRSWRRRSLQSARTLHEEPSHVGSRVSGLPRGGDAGTLHGGEMGRCKQRRMHPACWTLPRKCEMWTPIAIGLLHAALGLRGRVLRRVVIWMGGCGLGHRGGGEGRAARGPRAVEIECCGRSPTRSAVYTVPSRLAASRLPRRSPRTRSRSLLHAHSDVGVRPHTRTTGTAHRTGRNPASRAGMRFFCLFCIGSPARHQGLCEQ